MSADVEVILGSSRFDPLDEQTNASENENNAGFDLDKMRAWVVQFHEPLAPAEGARLRDEFGLRLTEFVPSLSFLERLPAKAAFALREDPLVRAVAEFSPRMKVSPQTRDEATANANNDAFGVGTYNAVLFDGVDPVVIISHIEALGGRVLAVLAPPRPSNPATVRFTLPFSAGGCHRGRGGPVDRAGAGDPRRRREDYSSPALGNRRHFRSPVA